MMKERHLIDNLIDMKFSNLVTVTRVRVFEDGSKGLLKLSAVLR